jgi:hypothetical protein
MSNDTRSRKTPAHGRGAAAPRRTCKDRLAMQEMLATAVGGAVAAMNRYTNNEEEYNSTIEFLLIYILLVFNKLLV